ncbi:MAG TPA: hypothetical protein PLM98_03605 [Thiolinea sp.]|nr:hypothetical protein [Thiolinea sp.]
MLFKKTVLTLGLALVTLTTQAVDDWALKTKDLIISKATVEDAIKARGFTAATLDDKHRTALMQELFIREALLAKQATANLPADQLALLEKQVDDFRKGQLSRLILDSMALAKAPDFEPRAKELYEARKATDYQLPLRLRVRVLEKNLGTDEAAVRKHLEELQVQLVKGSLDFKSTVLAESDAEDKKLTEGDSFWFHQGQKVKVFYEAAAGLSAAKPISDVFVFDSKAYLLQFIGRQEAMQQTYAEVKDSILAELTKTYQEDQRKELIEQLRTSFHQDAEINPAYQ